MITATQKRPIVQTTPWSPKLKMPATRAAHDEQPISEHTTNCGKCSLPTHVIPSDLAALACMRERADSIVRVRTRGEFWLRKTGGVIAA